VSLDDRLSFGEGPSDPESPDDELEETSGDGRRPNRAFLFIVIAMAGLILLGILALVGALTVWLPRQKETQAARVTQTVDSLTRVAAAWTPTFTPSPTILPPTWTPTPLPTWTTAPTATATRVVQTVDPAQMTSTPTRAASSDWGGGTTPSAGLGVLGTTAIAMGLAGLVFATRRLRSAR
jgi:hypothetical protein